MKVLHVSLTARNADRLSTFYKGVFGCTEKRPPKRLSGDLVACGNGLPDSHIYSIWLNFPGARDPFLEIMEFDTPIDRNVPAVNEPGFAHLAFEVRDLKASIEKVLMLGGSLQGQITNFGTVERPYLIIYVRDPEGNVLELEQVGVAEVP